MTGHQGVSYRRWLFHAAGFQVIAPDLFDFVLVNELKRAVRSQTYLTLLLVEPSFADAPSDPDGEREPLTRLIAELIVPEIRETDLLAQTPSGQLSLVLLDADFSSSLGVVQRLVTRLTDYRFPRPVDITVGAACCPTHGADAESLRRRAASRPAVRRRCESGGNAVDSKKAAE